MPRENTLEAFSLARDMGATGIETDAWVTGDGEVVLVHDGAVARLPGLPNRGVLGRSISGLARARLPSHIPTLDELYEHCGTDLPLSVDVKDRAAFEGVVEAARARGAVERLWVCHHDAAVLGRWRAAAPEARLVHSTRLDRLPRGPERHAADLAEAGIDAVNMRRDDWNGGLTTLYHRFRRARLRLGRAAGPSHRRTGSMPASTPSTATTSTGWWRCWRGSDATRLSRRPATGPSGAS